MKQYTVQQNSYAANLFASPWLYDSFYSGISPKKTNLSLAFSSSCSSIALTEFFHSERKQSADPQGFIKPRCMKTLFELAQNGQVAMVSDQKQQIQALCVAYPSSAQINDQSYSITEIGTVLSCLKGMGLSELTIAALAQKIKDSNDNDHRIVAKVAANNKAANNFFAEKLGWDLVKEPETVKAYYTSDMGASARHRDYSELKNWYSFGDTAQVKSHLSLLDAKSKSEQNSYIHLDI